ncbi:MAG TPA: hypothetical protein VHE30_10755 [Polyangiaceae bacterium]|nr:hypothetical protein [Polyangiaceae bacterium]
MRFRARGLRATLLLFLSVLGSCFVARPASALTLQAPSGGEAFSLPGDSIVCGVPGAGWSFDSLKKRLRPPPDAAHRGSTIATIALSYAACGTSSAQAVTLVATGPLPTVDPSSVTLFLDAGRLEVRGEGLEGVRFMVAAGTRSSTDVCLNVTKDKGRDFCAVNVDRSLPADPLRISVHVIPDHGKAGVDVITYDKSGDSLPEEATRLPLARLVLGHVFGPSKTVDVSTGEGRVELVHPEAVASAECGIARCDATDGGVIVKSVPVPTTSIPVKLKLRPRVFLARGEAQDPVVADTLTVLRCAISLESGAPLRNADDTQVLVRLDPRCGKDTDSLRWTASGETAEVRRVETLDDGLYVLLWVGRVVTDQFTLVASRTEDGSVLGVVSVRTVEPPPLRTTLTLKGLGEIAFIPKNRDAVLSVSATSSAGALAPIAVPGAYTVKTEKDGPHIRGEPTSGGYTALRFAYRIPSVPQEFAGTSFATLVEPIQRPIRDASVPAPIGASSVGDKPIVELFCKTKKGLEQIAPGTSPHIPFSSRDSCRLMIHRERIPEDAGEQRLDIDISVTTLSGERPEAAVSHHLVLRHGDSTDLIWIRGADAQFDHIKIRATQVVDESQYEGRGTAKLSLPSAQWTVVTEDARFKFYATAAIPTALYRFSNDPQNLGTGPLALNFGVLSRLTWLDHDGHEGLVGLEGGVMGMGLATEKDRQMAIVAGLGVSVPLGNVNQPTQAAVNIHAWAAYTVGDHTGQLTDTAGNVTGTVKLNPWAFVFGPSITIGNVGTFL